MSDEGARRGDLIASVMKQAQAEGRSSIEVVEIGRQVRRLLWSENVSPPLLKSEPSPMAEADKPVEERAPDERSPRSEPETERPPHHNTFWSPEEEDRLWALYKRGLRLADIFPQFGRTPGAIEQRLCRLCKKHGYDPQDRRRMGYASSPNGEATSAAEQMNGTLRLTA